MTSLNVDSLCNLKELIIDQKESVYAFDLEKVPGTGDDAYFIMHTGKGLSLIDPANKKIYDLRFDDNTNYNMCQSISLTLVDDENPDRGFWLANIVNTNPFAPEIKVFDFNEEFIAHLRQTSEKVKAGKEEE